MPRKQSFNSARRYELFQLYVTPASIWVSHTESSKYLELCVVTNWVNFMPRIQSSKSPKPDHLNITHRAILKIMIQQITHTYTHNSDWPRDNDHILQHTGAHWSNTLQHTATHCNTLQHTVTTLQHMPFWLTSITHTYTHKQNPDRPRYHDHRHGQWHVPFGLLSPSTHQHHCCHQQHGSRGGRVACWAQDVGSRGENEASGKCCGWVCGVCGVWHGSACATYPCATHSCATHPRSEPYHQRPWSEHYHHRSWCEMYDHRHEHQWQHRNPPCISANQPYTSANEPCICTAHPCSDLYCQRHEH